jgi:hypothetical protein
LCQTGGRKDPLSDLGVNERVSLPTSGFAPNGDINVDGPGGVLIVWVADSSQTLLEISKPAEKLITDVSCSVT